MLTAFAVRRKGPTSVAYLGTNHKLLDQLWRKGQELQAEHDKQKAADAATTMKEKGNATLSEADRVRRHRKRYQHRRRMREAVRKLFAKVQHKVDETHHTAITYLTTFQVVLLPKFETASLVAKPRVLHASTARQLNLWAHHRFRQRLIAKAKTVPGCTVLIVDEHYSSQTCSNCGELNKVGGSEVYRCASCKAIADRDANAAKNILLRWLARNCELADAAAVATAVGFVPPTGTPAAATNLAAPAAAASHGSEHTLPLGATRADDAVVGADVPASPADVNGPLGS
jgi:transposase